MATKRRRGFTKVKAEDIALELRAELSLGIDAPLDALKLADLLALPVLAITDLVDLDANTRRYFTTGSGRALFSAATVYLSPQRRAIIVNPSHAKTRKGNSVCHEVGHVVLEHSPEEPLSLEARSWNGEQEDEADYLAGALLIPRDAAHAAAKAGRLDAEIAAQFGVSLAVARMRMNKTGARKRAARFHALVAKRSN